MGHVGHQKLRHAGSQESWRFSAIPISIVCLLSLGIIFLAGGIHGVEGFGYDDYGGEGGGPGHYPDPGDYDHHYPSSREDMMDDIRSQRRGYPDELSTKKKKFKLFEKRRLSHDKAKAFCKKREGQLAQAMNVDEMQRIQMLLMKGTTLTTSVWVGADKREWRKHSSKMLGMRPNLPPNAMMMGGGGPTNMCPSMSMSTRSLAPVECYKQFAFICEFPPGKGKAPPKKAKTKVTKKDEMRKKRETLKINSTGDAIHNDVTPPGTSAAVTEEANRRDNDTDLNETRNDNQGEVSTEAASEESNESVRQFEDRHPIQFRPHIEFSNEIGNIGNRRKVSSPYSESTAEYTSDENETGLLDSNSDEIGSQTTYDSGNSQTEMTSPEIGQENEFVTEEDADKKLLREFDEQLENMRQISNPEGPISSTSRRHPGVKSEMKTNQRNGKTASTEKSSDDNREPSSYSSTDTVRGLTDAAEVSASEPGSNTKETNEVSTDWTTTDMNHNNLDIENDDTTTEYGTTGSYESSVWTRASEVVSTTGDYEKDGVYRYMVENRSFPTFSPGAENAEEIELGTIPTMNRFIAT